MRYRVRYIAPDGKEKSQSFPDKKKREAQAFLAQVQADILKGTYVDPDAGRVIFKQSLRSVATSSTSASGSLRSALPPDDRRNRMHVLRHTCASVLLDAGESIKALSATWATPILASPSGPTHNQQ